MPDWKALALLPEEQLAEIDVAVVNLSCALGLPDAETINVQQCIQRLDRWAGYANQYTQTSLPEFLRNPSAYNNSEAYCRILCMVTALQRDMGLRYNEAKIPTDVPLDTSDTFLHGALFGAGGTCASIPVIYVAVGRRLGYPLKLVTARGRQGTDHLFCRWEDEQDRFNIEATALGLNCYPDDYYRRAPYVHNPQAEQFGGVLKSQSPRQELSGFLMARGFRWLDYGNHRQAANSFAWGWSLDVGNKLKKNTLIDTCNRWGKKLEALEPPHFPGMFYRWGPRRFPDALPFDFETDILSLEAWENALNDPEMNHRWWEPLRRGEWLPAVPKAINVQMSESGCRLSVELTRTF